MTVYTGLLDEEIDGIPFVPPTGNDWEDVHPMFELVTIFGAEDDDCWCDLLLPDFRRRGGVCTHAYFRWQPGEPVARFDAFTPPYARAVSRG